MFPPEMFEVSFRIAQLRREAALIDMAKSAKLGAAQTDARACRSQPARRRFAPRLCTRQRALIRWAGIALVSAMFLALSADFALATGANYSSGQAATMPRTVVAMTTLDAVQRLATTIVLRTVTTSVNIDRTVDDPRPTSSATIAHGVGGPFRVR
jgi:hypothetical protein